MIREISTCCLLLTIGCSAVDRTSAQPSLVNTRIVELPVEGTLEQCSRASPDVTGPFWTPDPDQIQEIEKQVTSSFASAGTAFDETMANERAEFPEAVVPIDFAEDRTRYTAEYVGYTSNDRKMIYGNFLPASDFYPVARNRLVVVCDGGFTFFGVEYDVESQSIKRIAFNGSLGGPFLPVIEP